ncbi:DNA-directed RNA polymerase, subunit 2 [Artemisia annua]|uniref:DNA-directed RNA polymerase n=1 Tax=Artemisia annua TaxID=35608 RepID=A0A2U1MNQ7_ARTAN|nr:DNA-directed RNA polymerase, subunit 2 [Artemisia annua]
MKVVSFVCSGEKFSADSGKDYLDLLPRHARLQNMTYSARMKVQFTREVYTQELVRSDKFKTGKDKYLDKKTLESEEREVYIGRIPVMVNSDSCWMSIAEKDDCDFDQGGYFIIKGAEKTFIAQEQIGLNRLWLGDNPWRVQYRILNKPIGPLFKVQFGLNSLNNPFVKKNVSLKGNAWNSNEGKGFGSSMLSNQFTADVDRFAEKLKQGSEELALKMEYSPNAVSKMDNGNRRIQFSAEEVYKGGSLLPSRLYTNLAITLLGLYNTLGSVVKCGYVNFGSNMG